MEDNELIHETPSHTPNFRTELARQLAELMPEVVADGKIDTAKLKELLAEDVADETERFGLFWPGKRRAMRAAQEPTTATLRPDKANSKDWDTTHNVFIEGDNLEVLKILQKHYHNKIKLIYIDPPYNTGKDFVYPDNYREGLGNYLKWTRQVTEGGHRVSTNSDSEGRYHSNWLNMMYPRLKLARNLLADDGVIFISIDDTEVSNLKRLCDEVFGEGNFMATIVWQKRTSPDMRTVVSQAHEYILLYARRKESAQPSFRKLELSEEQRSRFRNPDDDPRGPWVSSDFTAQGFGPNQMYRITTPAGVSYEPPAGRCWINVESVYLEQLAEGRFWFGADGASVPRRKTYLAESEGAVPWTWWTNKDVGHSQEAKKEVNSLFGAAEVFSTPKPLRLIKRMIQIATDSDSIILDFFAGSSTTAHAVMASNALDGGTRAFIEVQLPEPTPEGSEARKAGFATVADIARKRIEVAGEELQEESGLYGQQLDTGFRAFKLADTNMAKWNLSSSTDRTALEEHLFSLRDSAKDDATPDDLLTELLLKQGHSLTERITTTEIAGLDTRVVGDNLVLAYLDEAVKPTLDQLRALVAEGPAKIIVLEDAFHGDDELKTNLAQLCESKGIELWTA